MRGIEPEAPSAPDSPLEETRFEPSVPPLKERAEGLCAAVKRAVSETGLVMAEPPAWPSYRIGPHDSVFALGVVSVNYASLEFALTGVFANVIGLTDDFTRALLPKIGNEDRIALLRQALCGRDWPADLKEHITQFIDGFKILAENRNQLSIPIWLLSPKNE